MISISSFLGRKKPDCDAHTHLFDGVESAPDLLVPESKTTVTFADIKFLDPESYAEGVIPAAYDRFISEDYPAIKDRVILLSTSAIAEEAIAIFEKYPDTIKGFGEFQCYGFSSSRNTGLPYGNLRWIEPVMEYNDSKKMPVYIHYDMESGDKAKDLERLLNKHSDTPVVLCHCGMKRCIDNYGALAVVSELMRNHENLWVDISNEALELFAADSSCIIRLQPDRVVLGSDLNPVICNRPAREFRLSVDSVLTNMEVVNGYDVDFSGNLRRLFSME